MMFKATFNKSSVISLRSVLLVEETGVPREKHRSVANHYKIDIFLVKKQQKTK